MLLLFTGYKDFIIGGDLNFSGQFDTIEEAEKSLPTTGRDWARIVTFLDGKMKVVKSFFKSDEGDENEKWIVCINR